MNRREFCQAALSAATVALTGIVGPEGLLAQARERARPLNLRITDLKTIFVNTGSDENFLFVRIFTNQGLVGLGEGTLASKAATVEQAILEHERYLQGKDPTDIEGLWQDMFRGPRYRGGPVLMTAHQRHRNSAVGHPRPISRPAHLEVTGRKRPQQGSRLSACRRQHAAGIRRELAEKKGGRLDCLQRRFLEHPKQHHRPRPVSSRRAGQAEGRP